MELSALGNHTRKAVSSRSGAISDPINISSKKEEDIHSRRIRSAFSLVPAFQTSISKKDVKSDPTRMKINIFALHAIVSPYS